MDDFPRFMKSPANAISAGSQSDGIEGYVFDGVDGSQIAVWHCKSPGVSQEHVHSYDEYFVVLQGTYTVILRGEKIPVSAGEEYFIPRGLAHAGEYVGGTRTIHAFGGRRATRASDEAVDL